VLSKKIENAIQEINKKMNSEEEIFKTLKSICFDFCLKRFSLAIFSGKKEITESFYLYSTCSLKWEEHYKKNKYYLADPIFNSLQKVAIPFEWDIKNFKDLFPFQQVLLKHASAFGISSGITIPLPPRPTFHGFFTIFNQASLHPDIIYTLSLVANVCAEKIMGIKKSKFLENLTKREKEVLVQKSQGLTVKEISYILNISPPSTAFHLMNIRKKLGVQTSEQAVSKFLIHINHSPKF
jgi:DNA-binding CsgD family transcriptional regulator